MENHDPDEPLTFSVLGDKVVIAGPGLERRSMTIEQAQEVMMSLAEIITEINCRDSRA